MVYFNAIAVGILQRPVIRPVTDIVVACAAGIDFKFFRQTLAADLVNKEGLGQW